MATAPSFETLDLSPLSEPERVAFYGALFAMSAGDGDISADESDRITESLDLSGLSPDGRRQVLSQAIRPHPLERCLLLLKETSEEIRRGLMLNLIDVVLTDAAIQPGEHLGLHSARQILGLSHAEVADLHEMADVLLSDPRGRDARRPVRPFALDVSGDGAAPRLATDRPPDTPIAS